METKYKHTQFGTVTVSALLLGFTLTLYVLYFANIGTSGLGVGAALGIFLITTFASLTIEISSEKLRFFFGWGLIGSKYDLAGIQATEVVKNPWYYGFGLRLTPEGWLYNVSGLKAVLVTFKDGKKIRLGTDEPDKLKETLDSLIEPETNWTDESKAGKGFGIIVGVVIFFFVLFGTIGGFLIYSEQEPNIVVNTEFMEIDGLYGEKLPLDKITKVELRTSMPTILAKTNGYDSFSAVRKGGFRLEEIGVGKLFILSKEGPFLFLFLENEYRVINFPEAKKTKDLYQKILDQKAPSEN